MLSFPWVSASFGPKHRKHPPVPNKTKKKTFYVAGETYRQSRYLTPRPEIKKEKKRSHLFSRGPAIMSSHVMFSVIADVCRYGFADGSAQPWESGSGEVSDLGVG